ncbi:hypothetical protein Fcan01_22039 [Folsomia candida]|uniref:Uncharacterized protein n=1 Tax=Folsomia candida TaxID=158441 RepID=A0A226DDW7_FOLCA|nr:hypothetical protein Fcan01_22039 [Folsomia candida]
MCHRLKCIPFEFDKKSGRFVKTKSIGLIRMFKLQCVLTAIYCTAMFLNICFGPLTMSGRLQGFAMLLASLAAGIPRWNYSIDIAPIQIINAILDFEETIMDSLPKIPISRGTKAVKIFLFLVEVGVFSYPILVFLLLRFLPCTPPFILSMLAACERSPAMSLRYGIKLGVHMFETWMAFHNKYSGTTWILYVLLR